MSIALTCTCGVRLEIDDRFAGQAITCPDCQRNLQAPGSSVPSRRTSGLALASIILALVGAFTIVGTLAAVLVGIIALAQLGKKPAQLAGRGYAIGGIVIGTIMTAGTVFAVSSFELFGLTSFLSDANWAGKLDFGGPLEVIRDREGFAVTRPSTNWGEFKPPLGRVTGDFNNSSWDDLLLILPREDASILCFKVQVGFDNGIASCKDKFVRDFRNMNKVGLFNESPRGMRVSASVTVQETKWPPKKDGIEMVELLIDKTVAGEDKSFLVRLFRPDRDDSMYVVIGGVRRGHFHRLESQFREAVDSFRLIRRNDRPGW